MKSTYYTPKFEEFHNGFEYEHYMETLKSWIPETFFMNESHIRIVKHVDIQDENTVRKVRVKCLDEDDLLEIGFRKLGDNIFHEKNKIGITLNDNNVSIFKIESDDKFSYKFLGKLLNKSELLTVLKRIDYE